MEAEINRFLEITAADIHAALGAVGACDCTLASWAETLLIKFNVVEAGAMFYQPCGLNITADEKQVYLNWVNEQLAAIRTGQLELCAGHTGSDYPAVEWATPAVTEFTAAKIIADDMERNS
jgi:hypothetical protein